MTLCHSPFSDLCCKFAHPRQLTKTPLTHCFSEYFVAWKILNNESSKLFVTDAGGRFAPIAEFLARPIDAPNQSNPW
jgi:hypothetical protein